MIQVCVCTTNQSIAIGRRAPRKGKKNLRDSPRMKKKTAPAGRRGLRKQLTTKIETGPGGGKGGRVGEWLGE